MLFRSLVEHKKRLEPVWLKDLIVILFLTLEGNQVDTKVCEVVSARFRYGPNNYPYSEKSIEEAVRWFHKTDFIYRRQLSEFLSAQALDIDLSVLTKKPQGGKRFLARIAQLQDEGRKSEQEALNAAIPDA